MHFFGERYNLSFFLQRNLLPYTFLPKRRRYIFAVIKQENSFLELLKMALKVIAFCSILNIQPASKDPPRQGEKTPFSRGRVRLFQREFVREPQKKQIATSQIYNQLAITTAD
jgi:hypothetical protein